MFKYQISHILTRSGLKATALLLLLLLVVPSAFADDTTPRITIGGSVYGGGLRGAINTRNNESNQEVEGSGTTSVTIYEGEIGSAEAVADGNGNVFGGGFGPAARVLKTSVNIYGGTIWNSLYGGGEIAAVGIGYMDPPVDERVPILNHVERQGLTSVKLYKGHVKRDVFGGGRGYTYATDDGSFGDERLYTDGYVFGSTEVRIYGGKVGTPEGVADGYGNVFGGGNVGFLYSGNERKVTGVDQGIKESEFLENGKAYYVIPSGKPSSFFADPDDENRSGELSIACDVLIEPWCKTNANVTINGTAYGKGEYVKTSDLNHLIYKDDETETVPPEWNSLEEDGIIIYNAVFAGGNVSTGDDKVYAETTTVYGNVAATVNDLYHRDLITIGTDHVGGLYGDGNLTFADGYRELNLTCYGTDYYHLKPDVLESDFNQLNTREQAFYQKKYKCTSTYTNSKGKTYTENVDYIAQGVWEEMGATEQNNWVSAGFLSKYAGRLMNTIQRADFAGVFGCRLVLQGAMDRVLNKEGDELKFEDYTLNRIGELSLNKQHSPHETNETGEKCLGNYFGIYNQVNYLGALTSDVRFLEDKWTDQADHTRDGSAPTYYNKKNTDDIFNTVTLKNVATSENLIALASGVALELKQEPPKTGSAPANSWGTITGVIQLELINVIPGEGGGFVYARNEHGTPTRKTYTKDGVTKDYVRKFLSPNNNEGEAATHEEYVYNEDNKQRLQTSGNFVQGVSTDESNYQYIVDDCYPDKSDTGTEGLNWKAHYWYIRGTKYAYNQHISVYTGAAKMYQVSKGIELATGVSNGRLELVGVYPGYYCNIGENDDPVYIDDKKYEAGDPLSWWEWNQLNNAGDANLRYFDPDDIKNGHTYNRMTHDNGFVLSLEFDNSALSYWNPTTEVKSPEDDKKTVLAPSFHPKAAGIYGQHMYEKGSYIQKTEVQAYNTMVAAHPELSLSNQAGVDSEPVDGKRMCIQSWQPVSGGSFLLTKGVLVKDTDVPGLIDTYVTIMQSISDKTKSELESEARIRINESLRYCHKVNSSGYYGGSYYDATTPYNGLDGWGLLVSDDRKQWEFNNDALDLLNVIDKYTYKPNNPDIPTNVNLTTSPKAIISLYMSRDSRLLDLRKDKNLTVHFRYTYNDGTKDCQEDHYINITVEFKDELPDVGDLEQPDMVLAGTKIIFTLPQVAAGAYNITGGGWEYYSKQEDAIGHVEGTSFVNGRTPFYWYQDGYWVNYYALTQVGRQYSKTPIQVKVANYHDLNRVVEDADYLGIGMRKSWPEDYPEGTPESEQQRPPKIYINDYTDATDPTNSKSGLNLLKELFDKTNSDTKLSATVPGCSNLDIILRNDLEPLTANSWTAPIGSGDECFGGNLHGDGYTIKGLSASLFNKICGHVYNLGVMGSFSGSGITENLDGGSIENCWVKNDGTPTSEPIANSLTSSGKVVNCYYNSNKYTGDHPDGAIGKDANAFYNGSVAYELNGFFMKYKERTPEGDLTYLTPDYVANRYADGDFIYANGTIPTENDERYWETKNGEGKITDFGWTPKDDDYLFFGQKLNYGFMGETNLHEDKPTRIAERIDGTIANRVYRAAAYIQDDKLNPIKAYYNKSAVFAAKSADGLHDAYPGMTAIDFTGYQFKNGEGNTVYDTRPWIDHEGLSRFINADLTHNLLVYAPSDGDNTQKVLKEYMVDKEPAYKELTASTNIGARSVGTVAASTIADIRGHVIYKSGENTYQSASSHFLVDHHDVFVPIPYSLGKNMRMWYQRKPNYVNNKKGWEVVCLPFEAELVTTHQKGEITHFYKTSAGETYGDNAKGHEYWLREFKGKGNDTSIDGYPFFEADFDYPMATGSNAKVVKNTFLWDYYYNRSQQQDANTDEYQIYYSADRSYTGYPFIKACTPYLIGFPGERYYEFDLSGKFDPKHTAFNFDGNNYVEAQTITFASADGKDGGSVPVSNVEPVIGTDNNYEFQPSFVSQPLMANKHYTLADDGSHFEVVTAEDVTAEKKSEPFRPYFFNPSASTRRSGIYGILFGVIGGEGEEELTSDVEETAIDEPGELNVHAENRRIIVKSTLGEKIFVRIVNISGLTVRTFTIAPGETIETPVNLSGVYIVNHKKIAVK